MGAEIRGLNLYLSGLNPNLKLNNQKNRIHFGNTITQDLFQSNSIAFLFDEKEITKMISKNPNINEILQENNIPIHLNITELKDLQENHCKNTQDIAVQIVKNLPSAFRQLANLKDLKDAAMLHDFGKVLIPPEILNKKGMLSTHERKIMDLHSELGYQLLKSTTVNDEVLKLVKYHHGKYNGAPDINLQILNLADKYCALTENRVYRNKLSNKQALTIIYSDVQNGNVHPMIFNALVKAVQTNQISNIVKKY